VDLGFYGKKKKMSFTYRDSNPLLSIPQSSHYSVYATPVSKVPHSFLKSRKTEKRGDFFKPLRKNTVKIISLYWSWRQ